MSVLPCSCRIAGQRASPACGISSMRAASHALRQALAWPCRRCCDPGLASQQRMAGSTPSREVLLDRLRRAKEDELRFGRPAKNIWEDRRTWVLIAGLVAGLGWTYRQAAPCKHALQRCHQPFHQLSAWGLGTEQTWAWCELHAASWREAPSPTTCTWTSASQTSRQGASCWACMATLYRGLP